MSPIDDSLLSFYHRLAGTGLPCMVGGSIASMLYGEPRATLDIDLIVEAGIADVDVILGAFPRKRYYLPPREVVEIELSRVRDGSFQIVELASALKADIYLTGSDPLLAYGISHRRLETVADKEIHVAPATYVVAIKLRYYSISEQPKHLRDISSILAISPSEIDRERVDGWAREFHVEETWRRCMEAAGQDDG